MGFQEAWGAIASKFAEGGVAAGAMPYRSAAGVLSLTLGLVRMPTAVGTYHVKSQPFPVGTLATNTVASLSLATGVADGLYFVYAHPTVDGSGNTTGFELKIGAALLQGKGGAACTTMAQALSNGYDGGTAGSAVAQQIGASVTVVPEPNYDASAFKMAAAVPTSDFYKGRSIKLALVQVATNDITNIDATVAARVV